MSLFLNSLITTSFAYLIVFDFLPPSIRLPIAGIIGLGFIALSMLALLKQNSAFEKLMFFSVMLIVAAWVIGQILDPISPMRALSDPIKGFRSIAPLFAGIAILSFRDKISSRLLYSLAGLIILFALFIALTQPMISLGGKMRLHPFTGGGPHASGFAMALSIIILYELIKNKTISILSGLVFIIPALTLTLGYQVRVTWVLLVAFFATEIILWVRNNIWKGQFFLLMISQFLIALIAFILLLLSMFVDFSTISDFSSGRLSVYLERFNMLSLRTIIPFLFGTGPGSDLIASDTWWWAAKVSHSDFIRFTVEGGILALVAIILYMWSVRKIGKISALPYIIALISSSMISNALFERPAVFPLFFIALAVRIYSNDLKQSIKYVSYKKALVNDSIKNISAHHK